MREIKGIYFWTLVFALVLLLFPFKNLFSQTWTGSGTKLDPWIIDTYQELLDLSNNTYYAMDAGAYFALGADIHCTYDDTPGNTNAFPVIDGTGTQAWANHLDGRGYTIYNLDKDYDYTVGGGITSFRGMFRQITWKSSPTVADTSTPIIQNIVFDSLRIGGTWTTIEGSQLLWGALAGSYSSATVVTNTPGVDSVIFRNVITRDWVLDGWAQAMTGTVLSISSTTTYTSRVFLENSTIAQERKNISSRVTSSYRGNAFGGLYGSVYTDARLYQCGVSNVDITITEGLNSDQINAGILIGTAHYHSDVYDSYVQGSLTMVGTASVASWLGGFVGYLDDVAGTSNIIQFHGCYAAVTFTKSTNDRAGIVYSEAKTGLPQAYNLYADQTISSEPLGYSGGSDIFQGDASGDTFGQTAAAVGKSTALMQQKSTYDVADPTSTGYPYDFTNIWSIATAEYPQLRWTTASITDAVIIEIPVDGGVYASPVNIRWTGIGTHYDSTTVNGTSVNGDTVFTTGSLSNGTYPIAVKLQSDPTIGDSVTITILNGGNYSLDSGYATVDSLYFLLTSSDIDSTKYYIGTDTTSLIHLGNRANGPGVITQTYVFPKPAGFFSADTIWYKVVTLNTVNTNIAPQVLNSLGQIGGNQVCWTGTTSPVEIQGERDLGCGWVSNIDYTCTTAFLGLTNNTAPEYIQSSTVLTALQRQNGEVCHLPGSGYALTFIDTVANDTTENRYLDLVQYNHQAIPMVYNARSYYYSNDSVLVDDLVNGITGQFVATVPSAMVNRSLWLFEYNTSVGLVKYATGEDPWAKIKLDTAVILMFDNSDFERAWSFYPYSAPVSTAPQTDFFLSTSGTNDVRDYFRGVFPKAIKHGSGN